MKERDIFSFTRISNAKVIKSAMCVMTNFFPAKRYRPKVCSSFQKFEKCRHSWEIPRSNLKNENIYTFLIKTDSILQNLGDYIILPTKIDIIINQFRAVFAAQHPLYTFCLARLNLRYMYCNMFSIRTAL